MNREIVSSAVRASLVAVASLVCFAACGSDGEEPAATVAKQASPQIDGPLQSPEETCLEEASKESESLRHSGESDRDVQKFFQVQVAKCLAPDDEECMAYVTGLTNALTYRLAAATAAGTLSPSDYLKSMRSLGQKVKRARADSSYCNAMKAGDGDGDLVPDDRDVCRATPDLEATDARGCPLPAAEQREILGPTPAVASALLAQQQILVSSACKDAPAPEMPAPLSLATEQLHVVLRTSLVTNQPPGCDVMYEVDAAGWGASMPDAPSHAHTAFRSSEDQGDAAGTKFVIRFHNPMFCRGPGCKNPIYYSFSRNPPGRYQLAVSTSLQPTRQFRVRAVNGAGLASEWSSIKISGRP